MHFTATLLTLAASIAAVTAAPTAQRISARDDSVTVGLWGAADAYYIVNIPVDGQPHSTKGNPLSSLSISAVSWSDTEWGVTCTFTGVDQVRAPVVLSNQVNGQWQVGPPQTITSITCTY